MQNAKQTAGRNAPVPPVRQSFSFTCTCCEQTEHRPTPEAPADWSIEYIDENAYIFCPPCALDLPRGDLQ